MESESKHFYRIVVYTVIQYSYIRGSKKCIKNKIPPTGIEPVATGSLLHLKVLRSTN